MGFYLNKKMQLQRVILLVQLYQMSFFVFVKENCLKNALLNLNQFFMADMLMVFLFCSNQRIISKKFRSYLNTCHPSMYFSFEN